MSFLTSRQKEFRLAALEAKRKGEINQAKEFLRLAKGFEPLLDAASSGLPIDLNSVSHFSNIIFLLFYFINFQF